MDEDRIERAAALLATARLEQKRFDHLPNDGRLQGEKEAYLAQDRLHAILANTRSSRLIGRKIGCTTPVMQRYLGIESPCAGGLFDDGLFETGIRLHHRDFRRVGVECEIAVRLSDDLPAVAGGYDPDRIRGAVESCMAAIEIVDDRYVDYQSLDTPTLIADDFLNAGAVLGPAVSDWRSLDLAGLRGRMAVNGEVVGEGVGAAILGHPFKALAWLAHSMNARSQSLQAGDIVLLGSLVQTQWIEAGSVVEITVEGLGEASVTFE